MTDVFSPPTPRPLPTFTAHTGRALLDALLPGRFDHLARQVARDHDVDVPYAERVIDQTVAFLAASAINTGEPLGPSPIVDWGWRVFILRSRDYALFCDLVAARFLHHDPDTDTPAGDAPVDAGTRIDRTLQAIDTAGFKVDRELWPKVTKHGSATRTDRPVES